MYVYFVEYLMYAQHSKYNNIIVSFLWYQEYQGLGMAANITYDMLSGATKSKLRKHQNINYMKVGFMQS